MFSSGETFANGLVRQYYKFSEIETCTIFITPDSICLRMWFNLWPKCFERSLIASSVMTATADVLSLKTIIGYVCWWEMSNQKDFVQDRWPAVLEATIYSTSEVDRAITVWCWLHQDTLLLFMRHMYPMTELLFCGHCKGSASEATVWGSFWQPYVNST